MLKTRKYCAKQASERSDRDALHAVFTQELKYGQNFGGRFRFVLHKRNILEIVQILKLMGGDEEAVFCDS